MKNYIKTLNDNNSSDYGAKTDGNYRRQLDKNLIHDYIEKTDWKAESDYFNYTRFNGKNNIGRTIKCSNKEYLKRIQHDKTNI